jgi:hypothetical protein
MGNIKFDEGKVYEKNEKGEWILIKVIPEFKEGFRMSELEESLKKILS